MPGNYYKLHCEICNWTLVTNEAADVNNLYVYKQSSLQTSIPKIDPETKKLAESKFSEQAKKFRCPNCGRPVKAKRAPDPQEAIVQEKLRKEREEKEQKLRELFEKEGLERDEKKAGITTGRKSRSKR